MHTGLHIATFEPSLYPRNIFYENKISVFPRFHSISTAAVSLPTIGVSVTSYFLAPNHKSKLRNMSRRANIGIRYCPRYPILSTLFDFVFQKWTVLICFVRAFDKLHNLIFQLAKKIVPIYFINIYLDKGSSISMYAKHECPITYALCALLIWSIGLTPPPP